MERRAFGQTDVLVPTIGMGTWRTFDVRGAAAEQHARTIVDTALAAGADFFDTSPMYGAAGRVLGIPLRWPPSQALVAPKVWAPPPTRGPAPITRARAL